MSLASLAVRYATIRALKGRTFAGNNVCDSKIEPINLIGEKGKDYAIIVTTDDDDVKITGRDLFAGDHQLELVIEVVATAKLRVEKEGGNGEVEEVWTIPASDAGLEAQMNLIGWQIARELAADGGAWGDLWRRLVMRVHSVISRRGADETNGVRYAARQYVYKIDHIAEPEPGKAPGAADVWARAISMMKADPEFAEIGQIVEHTITANEPQPWERVRAALGLADDASGHFAEWPFEPEEVATLQEIETTDAWLLDTEVAEQADGPEDS